MDGGPNTSTNHYLKTSECLYHSFSAVISCVSVCVYNLLNLCLETQILESLNTGTDNKTTIYSPSLADEEHLDFTRKRKCWINYSQTLGAWETDLFSTKFYGHVWSPPNFFPNWRTCQTTGHWLQNWSSYQLLLEALTVWADTLTECQVFFLSTCNCMNGEETTPGGCFCFLVFIHLFIF